MTDPGDDPTPTPVDRYTLFQILLPRIYQLDTDLVTKLLFCNNADLSDACEGVLYASIEVDIEVPGYTSLEDDGERGRNRGKVECLLEFPRLGQHVRRLTFRHPPPSTRQTAPAADGNTREAERMQAWTLAASLLKICTNLESFGWELCFGIGGDMWRGISAANTLTHLDLGQPDLRQFCSAQSAALPRISPELEYLLPARQSPSEGVALTGSGGWGLGHGWESLRLLKVAGLSQYGARTLATHLQLLCSRATPTIAFLDISTHFLDSTLVSAITEYGQLGSLKHLTLATGGTRLTAECLQQALQGCQALESFTLKDSEGRLDKNTWALEAWPSTLTSFEIEIEESVGHHSWVLHHLASVAHVPFAQLGTFAVRRIVHPIALLPFPPVGVAIPTVQKGHELRAVPQDLLDAVTKGEGGSRMKNLCLDWWEMGPNELDGLVKACTGLQRLQVAISFPLVKLITLMQTTFAGSAEIEEMIFTSQPKYNLEFAPAKSKADYTVPNMHPYLVSKLQDPDPSIAETKDLRKFVRRLPKLKSLKWTGRGGKGEWSFAKKTTLVSVSFKHSAVLTQRDWEMCQLDPPFFEYAEPVSTRPTVLEMPPPATLVSSPIAEFPSLSRSTSASASSIRQPVTPGSPTQSKSLSIKEVNNRLHGLGITPDEEDEAEVATPGGISASTSAPKRPNRRETADGSILSAGGSSGSGALHKGRQASLDLAKSTKRLIIGSEPKSAKSSSSSSTLTAPDMLKTTSAPARSGGHGDKLSTTIAASGAGKTKSSEKDSKGSIGSRGRKVDGPRHSK